MLLRGDTDFSQTEHLDRWNANPHVRFIFGYNATPNLKEMAENLPANAWQELKRPPRYPEARSQRSPHHAAAQRQATRPLSHLPGGNLP